MIAVSHLGAADHRRRGGEGLSGEFDDLQRAHDTATVGGQDRGGCVGVDEGELLMQAATPLSASRPSHLARTQASVAGNDHSSSRDWMYIIDPPTMIGAAPRPAIASMSAAAACW